LIVTGYLDHFYEELKDKYPFITTVKNKDFDKSGTMCSLYCARNYIKSDFLLLESDLIYEKKALVEALNFPQNNCLILSGTTKAGDEVFVEGDLGLVSKISKDPNEIKNKVGEFVGISKISTTLYEKMIFTSEYKFELSLQYDYDMDCLNNLAQEINVFYKEVNNLMWAEIDDGGQLLRAHKIRDNILAR